MKHSSVLKKATLALLLSPCLLHAVDAPFGIIGGSKGDNAYAAFVSTSGNLTPINNLPPFQENSYAEIFRVAMNKLGNSLISGVIYTDNPQNEQLYAGFVSNIGQVQNISNLPSSLSFQIEAAALNDKGIGLIGGDFYNGYSNAFAYLIPPSGQAIALNNLHPINGIINSVAISNSGIGIIGGSYAVNLEPYPYVALVSPLGEITQLTIPGKGQIRSVAINNSETGLIGGTQDKFIYAYAASVSSSGQVNSLINLPFNGSINSVAINDSGYGIIGGISGDQAYGALISPLGEMTLITSLPQAESSLDIVSINNLGISLIGGSFGDDEKHYHPYVAFVSPAGVVSENLLPLGIDGSIVSLALNDAGAGLISLNGHIPAVLVTPSGNTVILSLPSDTHINSVAVFLSQIPTYGLSGNNLIFANYINENAPQKGFYFFPALFEGSYERALESAAPTRNAISLFTASNNLFYLSNTLSTRLRYSLHDKAKTNCSTMARARLNESELLTSLSDEVAWGRRPPSQIEETPPPPPLSSPPPPKKRPYQLWFDGVGAFSFQKSQHQTVGFDPKTGAAILGFDSVIGKQGKMGVGVAYSYTHVHEDHDAGHSNIHQEYLFGYGSYQPGRFYLDTALWAGLFQIDQVRHIEMTGFEFKSTSHPKGWQLSPHLELGFYAIKKDAFILDPFIMLDWANSWQNSYKEKGSGPFNVGQDKHHSSLLRTEVGVRFLETISFEAWRLTFLEKLSYVNKHSYSVGSVQAFLVGSPGTFTVTTLSKAQNLGVAEVGMLFASKNPKHPQGSISYQGEFGALYQSHQATVEIAWKF